MNLVFLEEGLQSGTGHWPLYIGDIVSGFRKAGDHVDVLAHCQADPHLLAELRATPWFSRNCWAEPSRQGGLGGLRHALRYAHEVSAWLRRHPDVRWVCALTMRLQHLLAFSLLCRRPVHRGHRRYLLLFVQGFGVSQGPGLPVSFPPTASTRLARWCFRRLAPAVRSGRVMLAAETRAMQAELETFSQLPVMLFPHPVSLPADPAPPSPRISAQGSPPITITCPGFARYEKGNDLLQEACRQLFAAEPHRDLQVISQWPQPFALPDGSEAAPDPALLSDGRYQLINHSLDRAGYSALLARSDLIVLPYRRSSYHSRVSRVAIEAALHGVPLVFMSGTWCEEVVELTGAGVEIADETPEAVCQALSVAFNQLPELTQRAQHATAAVADYYSVQSFRREFVLATKGSRCDLRGELQCDHDNRMPMKLDSLGNRFYNMKSTQMPVKRVGIVSLYEWLKDWDNYGTVLQNYALQTTLKELGHDPFWIRTSYAKRPRLNKRALNFLKQILLSPGDLILLLCNSFAFKTFRRRSLSNLCTELKAFRAINPRHFSDFLSKHVPLSERQYEVVSIRKNYPEADAYIVGSDNVWAKVNDANFLGFGPSGATRIAYGVSAHWSKVSRYWEHQVRSRINNITHLSVRESQALNVCRRLGRSDALHVLDPTLLLKTEDYDFVTVADDELGKNGKFGLGYFVNLVELGQIPWEQMCDVASRLGVNYKVVPLQGAEVVIPRDYVYAPSVGQWLYAFRNARYVLTNSYHGVIFAILMQKSFLVFPQGPRQDRGGERIPSLLHLLGLEERIYYNESDMVQHLLMPIDWEFVAGVLATERLKSREFLRQSLGNPNL